MSDTFKDYMIMAKKKTVHVTVTMAELLYDISNETYLRGRMADDGTNYRKVAYMFASMDADNRDKILRSVKRAFAEVKTAVAEYLDESALSADDILQDSPDDIALHLSMPGNYDEAATEGMAEAVHDYIRNTAVADWYLVTDKGDAADYATLAARAMQSLRNAVNRRSRPTRPATATKAQG